MTRDKCVHAAISRIEGMMSEREHIVAWLRKPSEDGIDCSADREVIARQIERGEHIR